MLDTPKANAMAATFFMSGFGFANGFEGDESSPDSPSAAYSPSPSLPSSASAAPREGSPQLRTLAAECLEAGFAGGVVKAMNDVRVDQDDDDALCRAAAGFAEELTLYDLDDLDMIMVGAHTFSIKVSEVLNKHSAWDDAESIPTKVATSMMATMALSTAYALRGVNLHELNTLLEAVYITKENVKALSYKKVPAKELVFFNSNPAYSAEVARTLRDFLDDYILKVVSAASKDAFNPFAVEEIRRLRADLERL